ncbi:MAG: hypothetical protein R3C49_25745 [Planctomycetaceae bacterium]
MTTASRVICQAHRDQVQAAVAAAEARTSCEIVPVVASASGRYDRAEDLVGLWLAVIGGVAVFLNLPGPGPVGSWNESSHGLQALFLAGTMVLCFTAGALLADQFRTLRRLFTPQREMIEEVSRRARQLFYDRRVHHTAGASGLLIYVSLYERRAVVLGDRSVTEVLGESFLQGLCDRLTAGLAAADVASAICDTIQHAVGPLENALPRADGDVNELPDALVVID